ncbi:MAG TPA: DUF4242 domain-containing protein [Acidimicrobiales bacterium]|nr:DUF4242 domain-containing protein [Acidimicrobiales bacterium]
MPKYLVERWVPGVSCLTAAELSAIVDKSLAVLGDLGPGIRWVVSYVAGERMYCVYDAVDAELVREHARRTGLPVDAVTPMAAVLGPGSLAPGPIG